MSFAHNKLAVNRLCCIPWGNFRSALAGVPRQQSGSALRCSGLTDHTSCLRCNLHRVMTHGVRKLNISGGSTLCTPKHNLRCLSNSTCVSLGGVTTPVERPYHTGSWPRALYKQLCTLQPSQSLYNDPLVHSCTVLRPGSAAAVAAAASAAADATSIAACRAVALYFFFLPPSFPPFLLSAAASAGWSAPLMAAMAGVRSCHLRSASSTSLLSGCTCG